MLAAFWDDLQVCAGQRIFYKQGDAASNRYFVTEWRNVSRLSQPASAIAFEAVLYENGQILFQYLSVTGTLNSNTVSPENSASSAGLE